MSKFIEIKTCAECPRVHKDNGGGHCSAFIRCNKYNFILYDWDGPANFNIYNGIHPKCKLKDKK